VPIVNLAVRLRVVDPAAYTPPYDHALCAALARAGLQVTLATTPFDLAEVPAAEGYAVDARFYPRRLGEPGSPLRRVARLAQHVPGMGYERAQPADVSHYQWLPVPQVDAFLLPKRRPVVLTAHDVLPREAQPGQRSGLIRAYHRADAVVVHSEHGARRLREEVGLDPARIHVIPHGAFDHLADPARTPPAALPAELAEVDPRRPVVLCFGLVRPYKGVDVLLDAWRQVDGAELWIVGRPQVDLAALRRAAGPTVRFVPRFVTDGEAAAVFARADAVVLPYREIDQSGVLFTALAFGRPLVLTEVGGFPELAPTGAARLVPPGDADALAAALADVVADPAERARMGAAAARAAATTYAWTTVADAHRRLYESLIAVR
jgi:glycosyltransferase involved in cell wall biosynthesis